MKPIEYRVWCKNNEEWERDEIAIKPNGFILHMNMGKGKPFPCMVRADTHIIQFFTGRYDNQEKKIFDGDIIESNTGRRCQVVWFDSPDYCGWDLIALNDVGKPPQYHIWDVAVQGWKVIGNIFDNPELLEVSQNDH